MKFTKIKSKEERMKRRREYQRIYRNRPGIREHYLEYLRIYQQRPENKKHRHEYMKKYRQDPDFKEEYYNVSKRHNRKQKGQLVEYKGGKCKRCSIVADTTNLCIFEFHHLNPTEKDTNSVFNAMNLKTAKKEADKCILLCANCHRIEHYLKVE